MGNSLKSGRMNNEDMLTWIENQENNSSSEFDNAGGYRTDLPENKQIYKTTGSALWDFLGSAPWGAIDEVAMQLPQMRDTYLESIEGTAADTWEDFFKPEELQDAEWEDLSNWARLGEGIGRGLAMLPQAILGGTIAKEGIKKGIGKEAARKLGVHRSTQEILEKTTSETTKKLLKKNVDGLNKFVDDAYDMQSTARVAEQMDLGFSDDMLEEVLDNEFVSSIKKNLDIADDEVAKSLSKVSRDIITKNNIDDSLNLLQMKFANAGLGNTASFIAAATAQDALIGVGIGTLRSLARQGGKSAWGVQYNWETHTYEAGKSRGIDMNTGYDWLMNAAWDGLIFSAMGPVSFLKGGTGASHMQRGIDIASRMKVPYLPGLTKNARKFWKPLDKMSETDLKMHLTALDEISGRYINQSLPSKFRDMGSGWWYRASGKQGKADMIEALSHLRKTYITKAPVEWAKEFVGDMALSLPRMGMGIVAMNLPNLASQIYNNGWSWESIKGTLGPTPGDVASNVMMAAFFSRKPHSFHAPTSKGALMKAFNTGKVPEYLKGKQSQLRKVMGGLKTYGADGEKLNKMVGRFSNRPDPTKQMDTHEGVMRRVLDDSPEFTQIKEIMESTGQEVPGGVDLELGFNKYIKDQIQSGKMNKEEADAAFRNLHLAKKIINMYNQNSFYDVDYKNYTPEQAFKIANDLAQIEFNGSKIGSALTPDAILGDFLDKAVNRATQIPQEHLKQFMLEIYRAFDLTVSDADDTGRLLLPKIVNADWGEYKILQEIYHTLYAKGIQNNWIREGGPVDNDIIRNLSGDKFKAAENVRIKKSEDLMSHVWGEGWEKDHNLDPFILSSDAWTNSYHEILKIRRRHDAYDVFSGNSDNSMDPRDFTKSQNILNLIRVKKLPEISKPDGGKVDDTDFGEVVETVNKLHRYLRMLDPSIQDDSFKTLSYDQAKEISDFFTGEEGSGGIFGDLLSDSREMLAFDKHVRLKAMEKLGLNDVLVGLDHKAALLNLLTDPAFNYKGDSFVDKLPSLGEVTRRIDASDLHPETKKELKKFYTDLTLALEKSNFPIDITDTSLEEGGKGEWIYSLKKAYAIGQTSMDNLSRDRAKRIVSFFELELEKFQNGSKVLSDLDIDKMNVDDAKRKEHAEQLDAYLQDQKVTADILRDINDALESNNVYKLRALMKYESDIERAITKLSRVAKLGDRGNYMKTILELQQKINSSTQRIAMNESEIRNWYIEQLKSKNIPEKDVQEVIMKITNQQFANKWNIHSQELSSLLEVGQLNKKTADEMRSLARDILGDFYDNPEELKKYYRGRSTAANSAIKEINMMVNSLKKLADVLDFNPNSQSGKDNFNDFILKPLKLSMKINREILRDDYAQQNMKLPDNYNDMHFDNDIIGILTNYFAKKAIKTLKLDMRDGVKELVQSYKTMGETETRGVLGIIKMLDPNQNNIYILDKSATDSNGKVIRDVVGFGLNEINADLKSGNYKIKDYQGKREYLIHDKAESLNDVNRTPSQDLNIRFETIPLNEKTTLLVRIDSYNEGIYKELAAQFRGPIMGQGYNGGELYQKLLAVFNGNIPADSGLSRMLERVRNAKDPDAISEGIKLTRMILNHPAKLYELRDSIINNNGYMQDVASIQDVFKRDNLTETKNGYVPTMDNRLRTAIIYKNAESQAYKKVYNEIREWLEPGANGEFKKLRTISIDDEGKILDSNGDEVPGAMNVFDALSREKVRLAEMLKNNEINQKEHDDQVKLYENATKSIVDGDFLVSRKFYLASMAMIGLNPEMVHIDDNGNITGFKSGGIKPVVAHSDIQWSDKNASDYGKVEQFFAKTAFKYNPVLDAFMSKHGIDAITFKSANKISMRRDSANGVMNELYTKTNGVKSITNQRLNMSWEEYIMDDNNLNNLQIIDVPLESMSLRTVSHESDPLVGQNAGVHFNSNNGISEWIGLDLKLNKYMDSMHNSWNDPIYRSALAGEVFGKKAETGDPSVVNSAMSSIIQRSGLVIEPWAQKRLEENMIGYFMNNGSIAGGKVSHGSLDVMMNDSGVLKGSLRSDIDGRPTVRYFGEFLPSYYGAQKKFLKFGDDNTVHSVIIQRIKYSPEQTQYKPGLREADGYLVQFGKEVFLQVEGRQIDKDGNLRDIDTNNIVNESRAAIKANKKAYDAAIKLQDEAYELIPDRSSQADANIILSDNMKNVSVGALNSRQPRNMVGDIVISRMAIITDSNGDKTSSVPRESGNVSRMNAIDAIKPQDADFDMDKSFYYNAAPGEFWRETNSASGYMTGVDPNEGINKIFDPNNNNKLYSDTIPALISQANGGRDFTKDQVLHEVNQLRGQFIKMHQTVTYLANIFRNNKEVMTFSHNKLLQGGQNTLKLVLSNKSRYVNTVNNISEAATRFIDVYKNLPYLPSGNDFQKSQHIRKLQNEILFGVDGLFDIEYTVVDSKGNETTTKSSDNLLNPGFTKQLDALRMRLIDPLNTYLKYNKGLVADDMGVETKADLGAYAEAYQQLMNKLNYNWKSTDGVDFTGLNTANSYFALSSSPYDMAMSQMHIFHNKAVDHDTKGALGKSQSEAEIIADYIENGQNMQKYGGSPEAAYNRVFEFTMRNFVQDEHRMLKLAGLKSREKSIRIELENKQRFLKPGEPSTEADLLSGKLARTQEIIAQMEAAISYKYLDPQDNIIKTVSKADYLDVGKHVNKEQGSGSQSMQVVVAKNGNIKEVISPGQRNRKPIVKTDTIILNGRRFKISDGLHQKGLRMLFEAFSGLPKIKNIDGSWTKFDQYELMHNIDKKYKALISEMLRLKDESPQRKAGGDVLDLTVQNESIMYEYLFGVNAPRTEAEVKALILRMLTPGVSNKIVSMRSTNTKNTKSGVYDYYYYENLLSEKVMGLLSKMSAGEFKNGSHRDFAMDMLNDINNLKNVAAITMMRAGVDVDLTKSNLQIEAISPDGYMHKDRIIGDAVFEALESSNNAVREAAQVMVSYAKGKDMDPVILYKAERLLLREAQLDRSQVWKTIQNVSTDAGGVKDFGVTRRLISESDALTRTKLGEKGGNQEPVKPAIENIMACYDIN